MARWRKRRELWTSQIQYADFFSGLFEQITGMHFFMKDRHGFLMYASSGLLARYQIHDEEEFVGRTDHDINPAAMADAFVSDDRKILSGEVSSVERMELWWDRQGMPDWFLVNKRAVLDKGGKIHGVMGVIRRPMDAERSLPIFQTVARAVCLMRGGFRGPLIIAEVATQCGMSLRQLQRRFQTAFGVTPQDFLTKTRVLEAMRLLEQTVLSGAEIAEQCGFSDASAFTQHFRRWAGMTPSAYRRRREEMPVSEPAG